MSKNTLPPEVEKRFDDFKPYIKDISVGQYNDKGVNIGFKKAISLLKQFLADELQKQRDEIRREVVDEFMGQINSAIEIDDDEIIIQPRDVVNVIQDQVIEVYQDYLDQLERGQG